MTQNPERRLPLEGASNFRDLGGYKTKDGRTVRWRKIFRSGAMDRLSDADLVVLHDLGLRTICDLRHPEEQAMHPTRLSPFAPATIHSLPIRPHVPGDYRERIEANDPHAGALARDYMTEAYRCYVRDHAEAYRGLMQKLADPENHPLVFHCAAGKDRTGFGAALVLMTLGVPEESIFEDYLATNHYWTESVLRVQQDIPEAARKHFSAANDVYLRASINTLHEIYSSLDAYINDALKLEPGAVQWLRSLLLE